MKPTLPAHLLQTVELVAAGLSTHEVAARSGVTADAVKSRIVALLKLLGARDRAHAVAIAYRAGILHADPPPALDDWLVMDAPVKEMVEARRASGFTQAQVAQRLGKSTSWLTNRENGRHPFTVGTARGYADIVGVDLEATR